jgi:hypothetical protein
MRQHPFDHSSVRAASLRTTARWRTTPVIVLSLLLVIAGFGADARAQSVNGMASGIEGSVQPPILPPMPVGPAPVVTLPPGGGTADATALNLAP